MSSRRSQPVTRPVLLALCLLTVAVALAVAASTAHAALYKMVLCAGNNGSNSYGYTTNTVTAQHPGGIFDVINACGPASDPAGNDAWLRIVEHEPNGNAGNGAAGDVYYDTPPYVHFKTAGAYTREPNAFNEGWRARFWGIDFNNNGFQIMTQGAGLCNCNGQWGTTGSFGSHVWPGFNADFWRFVFELQCVRPAGCDRTNYNAADANSFVFILSDDSNSQVGLTTTNSLMAGAWVRGTQNVTFNVSDLGSGLRWEKMRIDNAQLWSWDHGPECNTNWTPVNGEWARAYQPCPTGGPYGRAVAVDTASLADGAHNVSACTQDFAQYEGLNGTQGETCDQRTIHVDNNPPGAPSGLFVNSANPQRYMDHFTAQFSLPPNQGSPIAAVHYNVVNAAGEVVQPERTLSGTDPTAVPNIEGPKQSGDYRLRVWLEDSVGLSGPATAAPVPRDTTPPAAPQGISVAAPSTPRSADGLDVHWHNIVDSGAPIDAVHYQVLNGAGAVVVSTKTVNGANVEAIENLEAPNDRGNFTLRLWLSDAEGNVGAPVSAPLAYDCLRSTIGGGQQLTAAFGDSATKTVAQGDGATLSGYLRGVGGNIVGAPLCVFSQVVTDSGREFLGLAITGSGGDYRFAIAPGPSRRVSAAYRPGQRELSATATLQTVVHPTFTARSTVVRNKHYAYFDGEIPGPHNDQVVIVLQVKSGKGWLAFRRYRTRNDGHFELAYKFNRTTRPTTYEMHAQVRETTGYPYLQGDSDPLMLRVLPESSKSAAQAGRHAKPRCPKHKRVVKSHGKIRCLKSHGKHHSHG